MSCLDRFLCTIALILATVAPSAGQVSIDDIQVYDPATGDPMSPYVGQQVTIEGVVAVTAGTYHPEILYVQDDTGGVMVHSYSPPPLVLGDRVEVVAVVAHVEGEVRLNSTGWTYIGPDSPPDAVPLTCTDVVSDYENMGTLAEVIGTITEVASPNFYFADGVDTVHVFISPSTGIALDDVDAGETYTVTGPITRRFGVIRLKPRYQTDLVDSGAVGSPPQVLSYDNSNWAPTEDEGWEFTFMVEEDGALTQALLHYRIVEDGPEWHTIGGAIGKRARGVYPVKFSGASSGKPSRIDFASEFTDDDDNVVQGPAGDFAAGTWAVSAIQNVDPCAPDQSSPLVGEPVNIEGVVVAVEADRMVLVDSSNVLKGVYPVKFSGASSGKPSAIDVFEGDQIRLGGRVVEEDGLTVLMPHMASAVFLLSFGNPLPEPPREHTDVLADDSLDDGDCNRGEAYESCWVRPWLSAVVDVSEFAATGRFSVASSVDGNDALIVAPANSTYVPQLGDILDIAGYMTYAGGAFMLVPRSDADIVVTSVTATDERVPSVVSEGFTTIAPNPFNPRTEIRFRTDAEGLCQLRVHDARGELVRQLVDERLPGGQEYTAGWDGVDSRGQRVASGVYFVRLRIGSRVSQVRKVTLVE